MTGFHFVTHLTFHVRGARRRTQDPRRGSEAHEYNRCYQRGNSVGYT